MSSYIELHCHSNYSFLDGASFPQELLLRAQELGMPALALTDHDGLYGMVKFIMVAREIGIKPIIGAELTLDDGYHLTLLAQNQTGYSNLCRLITRAQLDHEKGDPSLAWKHLDGHTDGLLALSACHRGEIAQYLIRGDTNEAVETTQRYLEVFGPGSFWIEVQRHMAGYDQRLSNDLIALAKELGVGYVATNNVHYATPKSRSLQDVLASIKHNTPLDGLGARRRPNSEFYLKSAKEMLELFPDHPEAVTNSFRIAEQCECLRVSPLAMLRGGEEEIPTCEPSGDRPIGTRTLRHPPRRLGGLFSPRLGYLPLCSRARYPCPGKRISCRIDSSLRSGHHSR